MSEYAPVRTITKIEANPALTSRRDEYRKMRVAAYCRVSTDEEDQMNSLDTQVKYYTGQDCGAPDLTKHRRPHRTKWHARYRSCSNTGCGTNW